MNPDLRNAIDELTNVLWSGGVAQPITYIEQILFLLYMKMLDEKAAQQEQEAKLTRKPVKNPLFPEQARRFRWGEWKFYSGPQLIKFVENEVFPYMQTLVGKDDTAAQYFTGAVLEIRDPNVLKTAIDIIDKRIGPLSKLPPDAKGDLFEYILRRAEDKGPLGQFRTPPQIRNFMVQMVDPDIGDTVFDPACGTGGFLLDAFEHIKTRHAEKVREVPIYGEEWLDRAAEKHKKLPTVQKIRQADPWTLTLSDKEYALLTQRSLYGYDVSRQMIRICTMNLVLHGLDTTCVRRADSLSQYGGLSDEDLNRRYRVILSNPPFAGDLHKESVREDINTGSRKTELLFLSLMMQSLAEDGRAAIVVPEGLLFGPTRAHVELRRDLVSKYDLQAVVSLPGGVFKPYAGVKTSVVVLRRNASGATTKRVWFYEVSADGRSLDDKRLETPEANDLPNLLEQWAKYRKGQFKKPPGTACGERWPNNQPGKCWYATVEQIEAADWNLSAGRYKPTLARDANHDKPGKILRDVIDLEERIEAEARSLLSSLGGEG